MKRNYIGMSCTFHDPALAIVDSEGQVVFAEATERYMQNKRAINCPVDDVNRIGNLIDEHCEKDADLVVAKTWSGRPLVYGLTRMAFELGARWGPSFAPKKVDGTPPSFSLVKSRRPLLQFRNWLVRSHINYYDQTSTNLGIRVALQAVRRHASGNNRPASAPQPAGKKLFQARFDHHLTHAAAACYSSPFRDAACAVIDGYGEFTSTAYYAYSDGKIEKLKQPQKSPASLGFFYGFICYACGFDPIKGEEWKVMGLAPYGKFDQRIYDELKAWQRIDGLRVDWGSRDSMQKTNLAALRDYDRADLAYNGQRVFQELMEELLGNLAGLGISKNLVLSGGCALNSSTNGRILERTPFENLYVYCAPGDDGNAVGAALLAYHEDNPGRLPSFETGSPYLGSAMSQETLEHTRTLGKIPGRSSWPGRVHEKAAELLTRGKIIGWVQGRAEFGPRALGNRSILADPRQPDIKDALNDRVKFREEFRPFAPSILHEYGREYFERYQESPYMDRTLLFRPAVRDKVPGVVHADGTGRLQTVKKEWNERYYLLIEAFRKLTGVPIVLNTSFNVMGKPIIHSVEDAIAVFYTSGLDALVIEDELIEK